MTQLELSPENTFLVGNPNQNLHLPLLGMGTTQKTTLGSGFKHILFSPLLGEMIQFDEHIFLMDGEKPPTFVWSRETSDIHEGNGVFLYWLNNLCARITFGFVFMWLLDQDTILEQVNISISNSNKLDLYNSASIFVLNTFLLTNISFSLSAVLSWWFQTAFPSPVGITQPLLLGWWPCP